MPSSCQSLTPLLEKLRNTRRRDQREVVRDLPVDVRVDLRVFRVVPLPAQVVPIGVRVVEEAPVRHRVVVGDETRVVLPQPFLSRDLQEVRHPVGVVALQAVERVRRGRAGKSGFMLNSVMSVGLPSDSESECSAPNVRLSVVTGMPGDLQPRDRVLAAAEQLRAATEIAVFVQARELRAQNDLVAERHVDHALRRLGGRSCRA